ncbi:MAG: precorrin-6y C5,15-methyltransferase (decarboxylating) subunit CbiE [Cyanobacteria bacterium P01_A01_bin.37]
MPSRVDDSLLDGRMIGNDTRKNDVPTRIHVVGIGLDGAEGLHPTIQQLIQQATLLVGGDRHLRYFPHHPGNVCVLGSLQTAIDTIRGHLLRPSLSGDDQPETIVPPLVIILASGDPLFFGIGRLLLQEFSPDDLTFHPHLSAVQLAFSRIKEPWQDALVLSVHGRSFHTLEEALTKGTHKIALFTDPTHSPDAIARLILALDRPHAYTIWVCENLGRADESVASYAVQDLATRSSDDFAALNVVILLRQPHGSGHPFSPSELPVIGIPDSYFASFGDRPGLMTKRETRLLILGELALKPQSVIWDIGAGTGSVSIEAARLCPSSTIYAIEKTAAGIRLIHSNMYRFQVDTIHPIQGSAPQHLETLPRPHHVFVGGSGGQLTPILNHCLTHLLANGTLVIALATLERLSEALSWVDMDAVRPHIARHRLLSCQLSRSVPVGPLTRLAPLNPVHLLSLTVSGTYP